MDTEITRKELIKTYQQAFKDINMAQHLTFATPTKVNLINLVNGSRTDVTYTKYTKEKIVQYLKSPETNSKELRDASIYLYEVSPQYRRLINYFSHMHTLAYTVTPVKFDINKVNEKSFRTSYKKALDFLEIMNIRHEMQKVQTVAFREDVFYGYIYQTKDSFYIRQLNPDYCKICSIEDGCFIYAFDFSYFRAHEDELVSYGPEFESKYRIYQNDNTLRWQELESKNEFCIKVNEDIIFPMVPFAGCLEGIYDIEDYKDLQKAKAEVENYKILALQIPMDDEGDFLLDLDLCKEFYKQIGNVLPSNIGAVMTPMPIKDYEFERSGATDSDKVSDAQRAFWDDAGICSLIFGGTDQSSASLKISIKADEQIVFALSRQIERNINRLLKNLSGTTKFKITFIDATYFHQDEVYTQLLQSAQYGIPNKLKIAAILGDMQADTVGALYIENEFLKLQEKMIPLSSSHTQSGDVTTSVGAPTKAEQGEDLSDDGEKTAENDSNAESA